MVRRARGVGLVIGQDGLSSVCIGHELGQQLAASRTSSRDHNRLRNALAKLRCRRHWALNVIAAFRVRLLKVCETPLGGLLRAIVNGGLDVVRVYLSSRLGPLLVSIAWTKLFHFFIAARFSGM